MKRFILLAVLLVVLATVHTQVPKDSDLEKMSNCLKAEGVAQTTEFILDLYYNKITLKHFVDSYIKMVSNGKSIMCLTTYGGKVYNSYFANGSPLAKIGYSLLYESNCTKDLGPAFIVLDMALASLKNIKTQWKQFLMNGFMLGLVSKQSFGDCKVAYEQIRDIWRN